jgi:hypothetical protein
MRNNGDLAYCATGVHLAARVENVRHILDANTITNLELGRSAGGANETLGIPLAGGDPRVMGSIVLAHGAFSPRRFC